MRELDKTIGDSDDSRSQQVCLDSFEGGSSDQNDVH